MAENGKHALITGSSRGIGRGIALKLAEGGVRVAIHYSQNEAAGVDTLAAGAQARQRRVGAPGRCAAAGPDHPDVWHGAGSIRQARHRRQQCAAGGPRLLLQHAAAAGPGADQELAHPGLDANGSARHTPEGVGNVTALFCSADAGWITGQVIYTHGGASLMNPEIPSEIQLG